ncbi:hypothetical protein AVEN_103719-1 [Araneus ventricosus]|uniref:Uncharacterized protein n=1 Tax=Araneus ventricosus TaxID=182803 RepID=A0A4Y2NEX4_ARAVE|nr:hypothetical protein AVEN_103719-1 [Araneus ventricosus]
MMRLWIDNEKTEELEIIKEIILRKFKSRKEVYLVLCEYYVKRGAKEEGRSLRKRVKICSSKRASRYTENF